MGKAWLPCIAVALANAPSLALAQDNAPETGWFDKAEVSFVLTGGNSQSSTLGLKNALERRWEKSTLKWNISAIRVETTTLTRTAVLRPPADVEVSQLKTSEKTAENYQTAAGFERKLSERFFWRLGTDYLKNEISGIDYRWSGIAGVGNTWFDRERTKLQTSYGVALTRQKDVVPDPERKATFVAGRLAWDYRLKITTSTTFTSVFGLEQNFDDFGDTRIETTNALAVSMSSRLALKVSLQLQYTSQPALLEVGVRTEDGADAGFAVSLPAREVDSFFNVSLVVDL